MNKVVIAIDSFKGSLTTFQAAEAIKEGIRQVYKDTEIITSPIADGGEGTVEAIIRATGGRMELADVCGPLGDRIKAAYGIVEHTKTAVIQMSAAAGITLLSESQLDIMNTTTFGVGELILDAISKGCENFIIGIGSSATNDGGVGMLQALGFEFLDINGNQVARGGKGLKDIVQIRTENAAPQLKECSFSVACDVKNVLCGENGCSAVYGPQKGATAQMIKDMDLWLGEYATLTKSHISSADADAEGSGAAGGMGFALMAYLNATLVSGIELVMAQTNLEQSIRDADLVVTGEGRLDGQSCMGKVPVGVAKLAKKYNKPVIAFCGAAADDAALCIAHGIDAFFPILKKPCSLDEAMDIDNAYRNLKDTATEVFRLIHTMI